MRDGNFVLSQHCRIELEVDGFSREDAKTAILNAKEFDNMTGDESHVRYVLFGTANDGRALNVVLFIHKGTVVVKTAYESFS